MTPARFREIAGRYSDLRIGLVGDICLDRYFEIDPERKEISIETNLPVHNVMRVRCQPGASGTILNNLVALGVGTIFPAAIIGTDGEGYELRRALARTRGVKLDWVIESPDRPTFTYSKPLLMHKGRAPEELSRLDTKNWTPTPEALQARMIEAVHFLAPNVDALILLDQVDIAETGVITRALLRAIAEIAERFPNLLILADSRRGLRDYPPVSLKMNAAELALMAGTTARPTLDQVREMALKLSLQTGRDIFVTLAEQGIVGARNGAVCHVAALPVRGEIDIVGAGDSVTANLTAAFSAGASLEEALRMAQLASSIVIHQLGTTGAATPRQMESLL